MVFNGFGCGEIDMDVDAFTNHEHRNHKNKIPAHSDSTPHFGLNSKISPLDLDEIFYYSMSDSTDFSNPVN